MIFEAPTGFGRSIANIVAAQNYATAYGRSWTCDAGTSSFRADLGGC
ncbi:MAG: hypothetical protein ACE5LS_06440 [Thermoplasmata archaeon]